MCGSNDFVKRSFSGRLPSKKMFVIVQWPKQITISIRKPISIKEIWKKAGVSFFGEMNEVIMY